MATEPDLLSRTTHLLRSMQDGSPEASAQLFEMLYGQLKDLARHQMAAERADHTLQATAVVHELWINLSKSSELRIESRQHFMRLAAQAMRAVLVDHARRRATDKRGAGREKVPLDDALAAWEADEVMDPVLLDDVLEKLRAHDERLATIVELRFFAGLTEVETAEVTDQSRRQVQHGWRIARAWLQRELERSGTSSE